MNKIKKKLETEISGLLREKYQGGICPAFIKEVIRLKKGEPLDYLIGWLPFLNCRIDLSFRPLIPRPETEYWTEKAIKIIQKIKGRVRVADIFSGSGCVGIAVLKNAKNAKVDFFELDKKLIKQIKLNLKTNNVPASRYRIFQGDAIKKLKNYYDFILANPPYIALKRKSLVQASVLKYEPQRALFAGSDGLLYINKILPKAQSRLKSRGQLWLEFDSFQKKKIENMLKKMKCQKWNFYRDQYRHWRYLQVFKGRL